MCEFKKESSDDIDFCVERLREIKMIMGALKKEEDELKAQICDFMGDADELYNERGFMLVSYKQAAPAFRIDAKALKEKMPDVYEEFLVQNKPSRKFLIK